MGNRGIGHRKYARTAIRLLNGNIQIAAVLCGIVVADGERPRRDGDLRDNTTFRRTVTLALLFATPRITGT